MATPRLAKDNAEEEILNIPLSLATLGTIPTIAAMPRALDGLLSKGYRFVTVSQLIALERRDLANDESSKELNYPSVSSEESLAFFSN